MEWSDYVFVMEDSHAARISGLFRDFNLKIEVLHIPDEYEYLDDELIELLESRINATLKIEYGF
jgi:predicted protein tyrosine phosphatase